MTCASLELFTSLSPLACWLAGSSGVPLHFANEAPVIETDID